MKYLIISALNSDLCTIMEIYGKEKNARYIMLTQSRILIVDYDMKIH